MTASPHFAQAPVARRLQVFLITALALIGVGYVALDKFILSKHPRADVDAAASAPMPTAVPEKSVAVLPFADMSEKKDQEYFSDGLSEELIDMLSRVQELRVPARTSSFYFKGKNEAVAGIAERLRVANVLSEGIPFVLVNGVPLVKSGQLVEGVFPRN